MKRNRLRTTDAPRAAILVLTALLVLAVVFLPAALFVGLSAFAALLFRLSFSGFAPSVSRLPEILPPGLGRSPPLFV